MSISNEARSALLLAAHDLAGADQSSHWDDLRRRFEKEDGGALSAESDAYLSGIADAMRFLQARASMPEPFKEWSSEQLALVDLQHRIRTP